MSRTVTKLRSIFPQREELGYWAITFIAYLVTAKLGYFLYTSIGTAPAFIWPPVGIAFAAVFLWGYRMWSAVALAACIAAATTSSLSIPFVVSSTIGNAAQALAGGYFFRYFHFRPNISRLRDTLLLLAAGFIITMIVPTGNLVMRLLTGTDLSAAVELWRVVWSGGVLSVLVLTPLITGFAEDLRIRRDRLLEHTAALIAVGAVTYLIFWTGLSSVIGIPLVYIMLVPLFWIALRFSPRSTALALFIASLIAIVGAVLNPPEGVLLGRWLFQTELLLEIFAVIFLVISSAIEDRRTATAELRAHVEQLERAIQTISEQDTAKSDFLAILAHELRNPLAPVLSTLELLRMRRTETDDEAALIGGAEQRLHMMGRLLDDLLDISRVSEKRLKLKKEYVNLRDIVMRSVDGARPLIDKFRHDLVISLPADELILYADPIRIEQVIVNVLNNAAKYTPEHGAIRLEAEAIESVARITISDNGTGIDPQMLRRIFEPFLQISHTKYGTSGVGIGLALAKELVALHDGRIEARSGGLGSGSTFVIEFPLAAIHAQTPTHAPKSRAADTTIPPLSILVIDDNQAGAEALGRLLAYRGHTTRLSFEGTSGLEAALHDSPEVILLDIGLPDLDGYEVARRLRAAGSRAFIIALTGYGQDEDRRRALEAGCDAHLTKPVGLNDIEQLLSSRSSS